MDRIGGVLPVALRIAVPHGVEDEGAQGERADTLMPTAQQFDTMAAQLDGAHETMSTFASNIVDDADPAVMQGTHIESVVRTAVDEAFGNAISASIACGALAELCRDRAAVCRQYTADYDNYLGRMDGFIEQVSELTPGSYIGSPPYPPPQPAPWADRG